MSVSDTVWQDVGRAQRWTLPDLDAMEPPPPEPQAAPAPEPAPEPQPVPEPEPEPEASSASETESAASAESGAQAGLHTAAELDDLQRVAYTEGFERGHSEGMESGASRVRDQAARVGALLDTLADPLRQTDLEVERTLVGLALTMARRLVRNAAQEPAALEQIVRDAIDCLAEPPATVEVHMNPDDCALLEEYLDAQELSSSWRLIGDPDLDRADVRVDASGAVVDARLDNRLKRLEAEMLGDF